MRARTAVWMSVWLVLSPAAAIGATSPADENSDLDAIPKSVTDALPPAASATSASDVESRIFWESALTVWDPQDDLLVAPPSAQPRYQERLSLDATYVWKPTKTVGFDLSDRLNAFAGDGTSWPSSGNLRNDFREAFASLVLAPQTFLEIGRINVKNGPALGYNPTDFFKTRTQVDLASIDPSASKQDRLGVLMAEVQKLFNGGAMTFAFAPGVEHETRLLTDPVASFDPLFGQTNASPRFLATLSYDGGGLSPQLLVYHDQIGTHLGASLSRVISNSVVAYAEWEGVNEASLSERAIEFGKETGSLPAGAPVVPQSSPAASFQSDLAAGASWTSSFELTVNLEFHFHQSGFTGDDFDRWVALGASHSSLASELWLVRQYAMDQQEPLMQQQVFLRMDWQDAFMKYLDLGLVSFVDPLDGSTLAQGSVRYDLSKRWTFGLYLSGAFGGTRRERGSLPWSKSAVLQLVRYW